MYKETSVDQRIEINVPWTGQYGLQQRGVGVGSQLPGVELSTSRPDLPAAGWSLPEAPLESELKEFLFTAVTGQTLSVTVRAGDEVTLPCNNVIKHQDKCNGTTWVFSRYKGLTAVELISLGKISNNLLDKAKSDRLSVTENCSLVIRKITREDAGRYTCRQYIRSEQQQGPDATVLLSVVTMTEEKVNDEVTLFCSVSTYRRCEHTVKWLYEGNKDEVETTPLSCSAMVTFPTLHLNQKSNYYELLKCNVTDETSGETLLLNASPQFSCEKTGGCTSEGKNDTSSEKNDTPTNQGWLRFIIVSVSLATLIITVVVVNVWMRTKGKQSQTDDDNAVHHDEDEDEEQAQQHGLQQHGVGVGSQLPGVELSTSRPDLPAVESDPVAPITRRENKRQRQRRRRRRRRRHTMHEFRINMTLFVILLLQFTVTGQTNLSFTVRAGDEVTLPCNNVIKHQDKCNSTIWLASRYEGLTAVELISLGKISKNLLDKDKSDRLSVTENCSLVIRKITVEDVGRYTCRQYIRSEQQQGPDATVLLSVVTMTGEKVNDAVTLFCSVSTYRRCEHTVKWLYEGNKDEVETTPLSCSARVTFPTLHLNQKSNYYEILKCNVTDKTSGKTLQFNANPQFSCEKTGGCTSEGKNDTSSEKNDTQGRLWLYILVAVGLAVLFAAVIVVVVIRRKRTKGNQTQMDKNMRLTSNPAVTPETNDDTADPEDGVSYASVSYTKKTNSKAKVRGKGDDDEGDAVTYSTVKASSSSPPAAGASADFSDLYATVNEPDK
ncbi:uncharacterized protein LOC141756587 [Sebastes fasciatus]|uniref:uncharacterized protein LOC141756587 n=1 Tax=Sebastes fasciatus TaxID=394691 RepID=UPI003D9E1010